MKTKILLVAALTPVGLALTGCGRHASEENPPVVANSISEKPVPSAMVPTNVPPPAPDLTNTNSSQTTNQQPTKG